MNMAVGGDAVRSYWLTQGMARALGVNLSAAIAAGRLGRDDLGVLVARCQMCGRASTCTGWLAQHGAGAGALPDYCANKAELEALRNA